MASIEEEKIVCKRDSTEVAEYRMTECYGGRNCKKAISCQLMGRVELAAK